MTFHKDWRKPPREWSAEGKEAAARMLSEKPLAELRRRQRLTQAQQKLAYEGLRDHPSSCARYQESLENLCVMEDYLARAVMLREFPNG